MHQPLEQPYTQTGGARIGWMNLTWPFAGLWSAPERLTIAASILGTYDFTPDQVCAVEPYGLLPFIGWGIRVRHCVPNYPQRIIFWSFASPNRVLRGIRGSGFIPAGADRPAPPAGSAMPIRWLPIVAVVVVWNCLWLFGLSRPGSALDRPGAAICAALFLIFALSLGTSISSTLQRLLLKPNHSVSEIRPFLRLLTFISGALLLILLILSVTGKPNSPLMPLVAPPIGTALDLTCERESTACAPVLSFILSAEPLAFSLTPSAPLRIITVNSD